MRKNEKLLSIVLILLGITYFIFALQAPILEGIFLVIAACALIFQGLWDLGIFKHFLDRF